MGPQHVEDSAQYGAPRRVPLMLRTANEGFGELLDLNDNMKNVNNIKVLKVL